METQHRHVSAFKLSHTEFHKAAIECQLHCYKYSQVLSVLAWSILYNSLRKVYLV